VLAFIFLVSTGALAQTSRPNENDMFGAPQKSVNRDQEGLESSKPAHDAFASGEVIDNALQIGGLLYQRFNYSVLKNSGASNDPVSMPTQFDMYLDARPNDRVRGFVDARFLYDSSRDQYGNTGSGTGAASAQYSSGSSAPSGLSTANTAVVNPQTVIDQAWLKFDVDRTVFVTAGKQHVKWGTSRFWNPTDVLSTQKRDPLIPYDLRLGTNMVKVALPLEGKKSGLYAITLLENTTPASTAGQLGEALRAETVIANAEMGVDAVYRFNTAPVYGADISAPLGPVDVYLEGAYVASAPGAHYDLVPNGFTSGSDLANEYTQAQNQQSAAQVSGGVNYSFGWRENRLATVGVEYFYNQLGYKDARSYPVLIFLNQYQPFYTGREYAAFYLTAEGPDSEKHTSYTFSTLANLSDSSYISRVDFSWRFLTYLTFDAFVDDHYGRPGGEFNFALNTPAMTYHGSNIPATSVPATVVDLGVALRLAF